MPEKQKLRDRAGRYEKRRHKRKSWQKLVSVLACLTVFCTVYTLILPALTLTADDEVYCGLEEHVHDESCYERRLICGLEEGEPDEGEALLIEAGHIHDESCYAETRALTCGLEEDAGHTHSEDCYDAEGQLICEQEERPGHTHTEDCYSSEQTLICGLEEGEPSAITAASGHVHSEECYELVLVCELEEHEHSLGCRSNPNADLETPEDWERAFEELELTGDYAADLLAIAQTQLGYTESRANFQVPEGEERTAGYTRYGAWYGIPYGDWCAMFVSFCLNYAQVPEAEFPRNAGCVTWIETLREDYGLYAERGSGYTPSPGDLVFFDWDGDGLSDHVGIAAALSESQPWQLEQPDRETALAASVETLTAAAREQTLLRTLTAEPLTLDALALEEEADPAEEAIPEEDIPEEAIPEEEEDIPEAEAPAYQSLITLEGNMNDAVTTVAYGLDDARILGYGRLPRQERLDFGGMRLLAIAPGTTVTATTQDITLNLYPCQYQVRGDEYNNFQHYLPVREDLTVTIPAGQAYTYTENGSTYQLIPVSALEPLAAYGYDMGADPECPLVYGTNLEKFKNEQVRYWGTWQYENSLNNSHSPYAATYETYNGEQYLALVSNHAGGNIWDYNWHNIYYAMLTVATDTVTPTGTVINLFDYWTTGQYDEDTIQNYMDTGINAGHTLKFFWPTNWALPNSGNGQINYNTVGDGVIQGIVGRTLDENGYPVLSGTNTAGGSGESLAYLFNPAITQEGKASYTNVSGLLWVDANGYYRYDGAQRGVQYDPKSNSLIEYTTPVVVAGGGSPYGQFFPFENAHQIALQSNIAAGVQHYFGMTLTTRFTQVYGGHTDLSRNTDCVYTFSGDDDMWVFIDGVLVADLGGTHSANSMTINFATGTVEINGVYPGKDKQTTTIKAMFEAAQIPIIEDEWKGDTFADNTFHTIKMFYMERGNWDSTLSLSFNLVDFTPTSIYKLDQYGSPVQGAQFSVYRADANYNQLSTTPVYVGVTDANGELIFTNSDGSFYSQLELEQLFGTHFILKETAAPEGYRLVSDEVYLRFDHNALICDNSAQSGVYASNNVLLTAPNVLRLADGWNKDYYTTGQSGTVNGNLFAVVLKKNGNGTDLNSWNPVYGTAEEGYTVVSGSGVGAALEAIRAQAALDHSLDGVQFRYKNGGVMQLELDHLPGEITQYLDYSNLDYASALASSEYAIAYYWTTGSLDQANAGNTWRVDTGSTAFSKAWGATIRVPNYENRLYFQKQNVEGEPVNGARFALYKAGAENGSYYYLANDGTRVYLEADDDADNKGTAHLNTPGGAAVAYSIDPTSGIITVGNLTVKPLETGDTGDDTVGGDFAQPGTGHFSGLASGYYLLREIDVPVPYQINPTAVPVFVDQSEVYADAGSPNDFVAVARDPGRLAPSLSDLAARGLDETLRWITESLRVSDDLSALRSGGGTVKGTAALQFDYSDGSQNSLFDYLPREGGTERLTTETGWSALDIYQDYAYGSEHKSDNSAYKDFRNEGNIASLFGRSTYVVVTDQRWIELQLEKLSFDGKTKLSGAEFLLYREQDGTKYYYRYDTATARSLWVTEQTQADTLSTGTTTYTPIQLHRLPTGIYYLQETKAPPGDYTLLEAPVQITVDADVKVDAGVYGTVTVTYNGVTYSTASTGESLWRVQRGDNTYTWNLTVPNYSSYRLPATGGGTERPFVLLGLGLMTASVLLGFALILIRRRPARSKSL